jgi:stearoyl-CoA desaturase (Delta-9 desaturase)
LSEKVFTTIKAAELGSYSLNWSTAFIDLMALIGWATELKTVSDELIRKRIFRTGASNLVDKKFAEEDAENLPLVWGWDDKDMQEEDKKLALVFNKSVSKSK